MCSAWDLTSLKELISLKVKHIKILQRAITTMTL